MKTFANQIKQINVLRCLAAAFRPGGLPPALVDDRKCALGSTSPAWRRRCGWRGVPRSSARGLRPMWTTRPRTPSGSLPVLIDACRSTPAHWGASSPWLPALGAQLRGFRSNRGNSVGLPEWDVALPHPQTSRRWVRGAAVVPHEVPPKQNLMGQLPYTQDGMPNGHRSPKCNLRDARVRDFQFVPAGCFEPNRGFRDVAQDLRVPHEPFIRQGYRRSSVHEHVAPHSTHGTFHNRGLDLG
ncbi:hypothetical protein T10_6972 [Trichinella papuae]|uniref:Uncharacterized protein n=1 Tax=Trichinella papuae TaxID=268474 RepID=A0A0V1MFQ9_9BILA|nr:hypothetical protein T10_6528 [Trichinella papuae]KRZ66686.1 hypothetical protein T10_4800 [Trichinella papuae]KRZ70354.1 hypothetical protein T10_6972 [Trichinella papuae]